MKKIKLTQGKVSLVDNSDYEYVNQFKWHYHHAGYANRNYLVNGKTKHDSIHRMLMNPPRGMHTDHINRNPLDNRRNNLRIVTNSINQYNRKSTNKGYSYDGRIKNKPWRARIRRNGKDYHIGYFKTAKQARLAYLEERP